MQITLRTLTGAATSSDVDPNDTPKVLKDQLIQQEGYDGASLKLCFKGKVLDDTKSLTELGFVGGEVVIIAGRKATAKPAAAAPTATPASAPAPSVAQAAVEAPPAQPASSEASPAPVESVAPAPVASAPAQPATPAAVAPAPQSALHGVDSSLVDGIVAMGFDDRNQVALALRAAYMNPDRAVEYLCTGIPPQALAQIQQQLQQQAPPPQQARAAAQLPAQRDVGAVSPLRLALAAIPQFEQIRAVVRQNPQSLPTVMAQLREHHPDVFTQVQANPQEFLAIMNEADDGQGVGGNVAGPAGARQFVITEADREPIQRLVTLGGGMWDERAASIVYVVCNRSEDLAANVLFDNGGMPAELAAAVMEGGLAPGDAEFDGADFEDDEESPQ